MPIGMRLSLIQQCALDARAENFDGGGEHEVAFLKEAVFNGCRCA